MTRFARVLLALATATALTGTVAAATHQAGAGASRPAVALPSIQVECIYIENSNGSVSTYCISV